MVNGRQKKKIMDEIDRWEQFLQAWKEDIYLQLSVYGIVVFVVLCVFIVLCWSHYGAAVSSVIDPKSGWSLIAIWRMFSLIYIATDGKTATLQNQPSLSDEDSEVIPRSPSLRYVVTRT